MTRHPHGDCARFPPSRHPPMSKAPILVADDQRDVLEALRLLLKGEATPSTRSSTRRSPRSARSKRATSTPR